MISRSGPPSLGPTFNYLPACSWAAHSLPQPCSGTWYKLRPSHLPYRALPIRQHLKWAWRSPRVISQAQHIYPFGPPPRPMADHSRPQPSSSSASTTNTTTASHHHASATTSTSYQASTSSTGATAPPLQQHYPHATSNRRRASQSSDEGRRSLKSSSSISGPRRSSTKAPSPHRDGSSRDNVAASSSSAAAMQRSASPSEQPTKYTKTGRISKAKKGLKVHLCESCGKVCRSSPFALRPWLGTVVVDPSHAPTRSPPPAMPGRKATTRFSA